ncbi:hypothetical protein B7463_g5877, partial [Scytalidium lignicola]
MLESKEAADVKDFAVASVEAAVDIDAARKDKALALLATHHVVFDPNSPEARRVLRKIDWRVMPLVFRVYLLQLMDKNALSFAAIMGVQKDTHLTADQYSWLGSMVYFGYLGGDIPAAYLMQRVPLAKYLSVMCMLWGIVVAMHAVCPNFASLAAVRLLLGFIEVCTTPAVMYITSSWYMKNEQITRVGLWYTTSGWAAVFGGFFAWAIYHANSFRWQGLFVFYGALTFCLGVIMFFFLAASPTEAKWLTEDEKVIALERVRDNKTGTEVWKFSWAQLKEAFLDIRLYMMFLLLVSTGLPNGGVTAFGTFTSQRPSIIAGFGFSTEQTTLLNMGSGSSQVAGTFVAMFIAKYTNRTIAGIYTLILACVDCAMMLGIPSSNNGARYGGYILTMQCSGTTKKIAFGAAYQLGYAVGNIIGPQTYRSNQAPNYYTAKYTMLAFLIFTAILIAIYGMIHKIWNTRRDKRDAIQPEGTILHFENEEFADITDFKMRSFRYPL